MTAMLEVIRALAVFFATSIPIAATLVVCFWLLLEEIEDHEMDIRRERMRERRRERRVD